MKAVHPRLLASLALLSVLGGALLVGQFACNEADILGGKVDSGAVDSTQLQDDIATPEDSKIACPGGLDLDGDGYGKNCPAGPDCNDADKYIYPGAKEVCDYKDNNCNNLIDEGVKNACGTCDPECKRFGDGPFKTDKTKDPNVKDANGVGINAAGDLVLQKTNTNFNYMWIANTLDALGTTGGCTYGNSSSFQPAKAPYCRGTISKIDTVTRKEVARYYTVTCHSKKGTTGCLDLHGKTIKRDFPHAPSRTAVDYNFDVWVANRAFGGQPSASKIANSLSDCIARNSNGIKDTSKDYNSDGVITLDCNGDGVPDNGSTTCTGAFAGKKPEFLGDDDECVLFTINYGDPAATPTSSGDIGRSICLDTGASTGASNAWVGTYYHNKNQNRFYRIDGTTGKLNGPYALTTGHYVYGCVVDSQGILWSADINGSVTYLNTKTPTQVGPLIKPPSPSNLKFYGIAIDGNNNIWFGGYSSYYVYRYRPDRSAWGNLHKGKWTWIKQPSACLHSRGIAADNRGKVWVAINNGYIFRVDQSLGDGYQDQSGSKSYWPVKGTTIIGVGVDFGGNVWGISYEHGVASRLDVDAKGDPKLPPTATTNTVIVGKNPYTYSDFTGYGLQNFTRPQGRYLYQIAPCAGGKKATWERVDWKATKPPGTDLLLRVRSGDKENMLGSWIGTYKTPPAKLNKGALIPLKPNPAVMLQVELTLSTHQKSITPILHEFNVTYSCAGVPK